MMLLSAGLLLKLPLFKRDAHDTPVIFVLPARRRLFRFIDFRLAPRYTPRG